MYTIFLTLKKIKYHGRKQPNHQKHFINHMVFSFVPDVYYMPKQHPLVLPNTQTHTKHINTHTAYFISFSSSLYNMCINMVIYGFCWPYLSSEPPSAPQQLISVVNETSVVLEWAPPRRLGGRSDTSYSLECLICQSGRHAQADSGTSQRNRSVSQPELHHSGTGMQSDQGIVGPEVPLGRGVLQSRTGEYPWPGSDSSSQLCLPCSSDVLFSPDQTGLQTTRVVVSKLRAHMRYTFIVHARNGVSQVSGAGPSPSVSVSITTNQAGEEERCCMR